MDNPAHIQWQQCLQLIKQSIPSEYYNTWFAPLEFLSFADGVLEVRVPTRYFAEYFDKHYVSYFMQAVHRCFGNGSIRLRYILPEEPVGNVQPDPLFNVGPTTAKKEPVVNRYSASTRFTT